MFKVINTQPTISVYNSTKKNGIVESFFSTLLPVESAYIVSLAIYIYIKKGISLILIPFLINNLYLFVIYNY